MGIDHARYVAYPTKLDRNAQTRRLLFSSKLGADAKYPTPNKAAAISIPRVPPAGHGSCEYCCIHSRCGPPRGPADNTAVVTAMCDRQKDDVSPHLSRSVPSPFPTSSPSRVLARHHLPPCACNNQQIWEMEESLASEFYMRVTGP